MNDNKEPFKIAITASALFKMDDCKKVFQEMGKDEYEHYMMERRDEPLEPGQLFYFVRKMLKLNNPNSEDDCDVVEFVLLSKNSPMAALRILNSLKHYNININRSFFTQSGSRLAYVKNMQADLFLSPNNADVEEVAAAGIAAACIHPMKQLPIEGKVDRLHIALDGDSCLFGSEADEIFTKYGKEQFRKNEDELVNKPLSGGLMKPLFMMLSRIKADQTISERVSVSISLVTARNQKSTLRALNTMIHWGAVPDNLIACNGTKKGPVLSALEADLYFDDAIKHVSCAAEERIVSAKVPPPSNIRAL